MSPINRTFWTASPDHTARLAAQIGDRLAPGDCILLEGPIGAGKTHFARALIQSLQDMPEDVPSPTFTLVQTYDTDRGEIWHADLYRMGSTMEVVELGLSEAFETAICLIEWPDRLGPMAPKDCLKIRISADTEQLDTRRLDCIWTDAKWAKLLDFDTDG